MCPIISVPELVIIAAIVLLMFALGRFPSIVGRIRCAILGLRTLVRSRNDLE